jgi:L-serine dehydratase
MKSLRELFRIGKGPSSSHTMGPDNAARIYAKRHPEAKSFEVTLYGSLAATGKGHMTDVTIIDVLSKIAPVNIVWQPKIFLPFHPNGMKFTADGGDEWTVYSIGGGALSEGKAEGDMFAAGGDVYEMHKIKDIMAWCKKTGHGYWEYVEQCEGPEIWDFLNEVFDTMEKAVHSSPTLQLGRPQGKFL